MKVAFAAQCGKPLHRLAAVPLPYKGEARLFLMLWRPAPCLPSSGEVAPKGSEGFPFPKAHRTAPLTELPDDFYALGVKSHFSEIIFLRSATAARVTGEDSTCLLILSQELMMVEWSRPKASPMRGRLRLVISRVR